MMISFIRKVQDIYVVQKVKLMKDTKNTIVQVFNENNSILKTRSDSGVDLIEIK